MYHIDAETTQSEVGKCLPDPLRTEIHLLAKHKHGNGHHHYIQGTISEEEFEHLVAKLRQSRDVAEAEEGNGISYYKHRQTDCQDLTQRPVKVAQIVSQQQIAIETGKVIKHAERIP